MPIVQLIALFYKDQYVESMQKLLGSWLDSTSNSDSDTEDNESNTSPLVIIFFFFFFFSFFFLYLKRKYHFEIFEFKLTVYNFEK